jgi:hypothetical protein
MQVGILGGTTNIVAHATSFTIGALRADSMDFVVTSGDEPFDKKQPDVAGILGPNLPQGYDTDLDFGAKKLNLISQNHCEGKVVYWPAQTVAVVPMRVSAEGNILIPVSLDGHPLTALLDTGSPDTILNLDVAEATFGLRPNTTELAAIGNLGQYSTVYKASSNRYLWKDLP